MKFEGVLEDVGSFGIFQRVLCFVLIPLTTGMCGLTYYTQIFILTAPQHYCKQPALHNGGIIGGTESELLPHTLSLDWNETQSAIDEFQQRNGLNNFSSVEEDFVCHQSEGLTFHDVHSSKTFNQSKAGFVKEKCKNGWDYNYEKLFPTLTSERNWVCDDSWRPYVIITCFWVGNMVGAWIFGVFGDRFGRRPVIALAHLVYGVSGLASVFVGNFWGFLILRFFVGSAHHTVSHLPFILVVEFCGIKSRVIPLFTIMMVYTAASIISPLLALMLWDWRTLLFISSLPSFIILLGYRWLPESPSWMLTKQKIGPAINQLEKVSKINRIPKSKEYLLRRISQVSETSLEACDDTPPIANELSSHSIIKLLAYPNLRKNVLFVLLVWMLGCLCYYGHCQNTAHLGSDIFVSYLLGATVEIPSWCVPLIIHKVGRKKPLITAFAVSGFASIAYAVLPKHLENVAFSFALLGRLFITGAYYITLQYGPEIFPTVIRGQGVALSETLGGVAIFVSPLIVYMGEYNATFPLLVFGALSVIGAATTIFLPETGGAALPQTLEQGENFARRK